MKAREWKIEYKIPDLPEELLRAGYNPLLAYVLAIRGITTAAEASSLIEENETVLHDPLRSGIYALQGIPLELR